MGDTLRVGIIGAGRAGQCHAAAYRRLPDVVVTGLWNRTRSRAEELAAGLHHPDLRVHDDWRDLIRADDVDIISIATAPTLRLDPFAEALARGRHVLVEKPLALHVAEAQEMAALAEQARTVTAISFNWRYSPGCQTTWRALREGQIGRLLDLHTEWRLRSGPLLTSWAVGGSLREVGSHEFDRASFLTGWRFERVVGSLTTPAIEAPIPADSAAFVMAQLSDQGLASFRFTLTPGQPERRVTICGEEGTLALSSDWKTVRPDHEKDHTMTLSNEVRVVRQRTDDADPVELEIAAADRQPPEILSGQHTWNRLIADFVTAVRRGDLRHQSVPHLAHVSDGLAAQRVIDCCERSHAGGGWVELQASV